jgi:hypothetical protein
MKTSKILSLSVLALAVIVAKLWAFEIVSPAQNTIVHPGDTVLIRVQLSPGEVVGGFYFDAFHAFIEMPPYEYHYKIGPNQLGDIVIPILAIKPRASGPFATANEAVSSELELHLKSTLSSTVKILSYSVEPPAHFALHITAPDAQGNIDADQEQIAVYAVYSDGIKREISRAVDGTSYSSNNKTVVKVSADGLATAVGPGTANITIRNGSYKAVIDVLVVKTN